MTPKWRVLLVDDEEDVHAITKLALRNKRWRGREYELTSVHSAAAARRSLKNEPAFDVAIVDVVMESRHAGLDFCELLRESAPRSTRIILRTGQPGIAPEQRILSEYDIDYYLAKTEATQERLLSTIQACLRASQEIGTLLMLSDQVRLLSVALSDAETKLSDVLRVLDDGLRFLGAKHSAELVFVLDATNPALGVAGTEGSATIRIGDASISEGDICAAIVAAHEAGVTRGAIVDAARFELPRSTYLFLPPRLASLSESNDGQGEPPRAPEAGKGWLAKLFAGKKQSTLEPPTPRRGGVFIRPHDDLASPRMLLLLAQDLSLLLQNWYLIHPLRYLNDPNDPANGSPEPASSAAKEQT